MKGRGGGSSDVLLPEERKMSASTIREEGREALPISAGKALPALLAIYARVALGVGFLSAVMDRFGIWGPPGASRVAWGDFERFTAYTAQLNGFLPAALIPAVAWLATGLEVALGLALIAGFRTKWAAGLSGLLLLLFALAMAFASGIKSPLDASVFSASAAAFLLAARERDA